MAGLRHPADTLHAAGGRRASGGARSARCRCRSPVMTVALLFGIVFTFTDMAAVFVLTGGGPGNATQVLASWAFYKGINGGNLAVGAADALIMFPVLLGLAAILLRIASRAEVG
jgi:multiple sugar transport system permease protein